MRTKVAPAPALHPGVFLILFVLTSLLCGACSRPPPPKSAAAWPQLAAGEQAVLFTGDVFLGAQVTVLGLSETQLDRDRQAAAHYGHRVTTVAGDMRDLTCFEESAFDVVYHPYPINFVPDTGPVFDGVARVLREDGLYHLGCHNPFSHGIGEDLRDGEGYLLSQPYVDGAEVKYADPHWEVSDGDDQVRRVLRPREFRHTLSPLLSGLFRRGFVLLSLCEEPSGDPGAAPGTWGHFVSVSPPYLALWTVLRPSAHRSVCLSGNAD